MAQQETSALFSLKELMRLEDDRVRQEQELRRREAAERERAHREAERAAREREQTRLRRLEEERVAEEARRRAEEVRLEAIRAAEIERARVEAVERTRNEARAAERVHEQKLAALAADETKSKLRRGLWIGAVALGALFAAGPILYFGKIKPNAEQDSQSLQDLMEAQRERRGQLERERDLLNQRVHELENRVREEQTAPQATEPQAPPKRVIQRPAAPPRKTPGAQPGPCTCDPHDPLCGCFAR